MVLFILLVACTTTYAIHLPVKPHYKLDDATNLFEDFVQKYDKVYSPDEYLNRLEIFKSNLREINEHNAKHSGAEFGINHFTDLTAEESKRYFSFMSPDDPYHEEAVYLDISDEELADLPDRFDWREHNVVTRVKDQDICVSGWIFSAIGAIESQYAIKHNQTIELSEQQALDCMDPYDRVTNCHGGLPHAVMFVKIKEDPQQQQEYNSTSPALTTKQYHLLSNNHNMDGAILEKDYNYTGKQSVCVEDVLKPAVKVNSVTFYNPTEKALMKLLVEKGPLSVALQGIGLLWYWNDIALGIYNCYGAVNHAALLVGYDYDEDSGQKYWILKNSWGEKWGKQGYFLLERGANACYMGTSYTAVCTVE